MNEYQDMDGNPTTLYKLVRIEPDWAVSRIDFMNNKIAELENPWISVEDGLPDVGKWYLCWSRNQAQIIFLDTAEPIIWLQDGDYLENVTHWMPLPVSPKALKEQVK